MDLQRIGGYQQAKAFKWGLWFLLALSFSLLSFFQIVYYEQWIILCTVLLSALIGFFLIRKTWDEIAAYVWAHPFQAIAYFFAALMVVRAMHLEKGSVYLNTVFHPLPFLAIRFFRFRWMIFAIPALFYLLLWIGIRVTELISRLWRGLDKTDRKLYLYLTLAASAAVLTAYAVNSAWFLQYDAVYSIDSGYCFSKLFPRLSYYNIRHPIMSVATFPIWAVIHTALQWLAPAQLLDILCAACIQLVNVQLLLLTGFMIRELSNSRWTLMLYLVSSPVLLFTIFFEKYQMAVFFLVLYAYRRCNGEERANADFVLAAGMMPSSAFLCIDELLHKEPIGVKMKRIGQIFLFGITVLICTGRIHLLNPHTLLEEAFSMTADFGMKGYPLQNCFFSLTNMVHGAFLGLSSVSSDEKYLWTDVLNKPSVIGLVILFIAFLGFISNRRDHFARICAVWTVFAAILLCLVQWSVHESPLFSVYFAWALIPLFQNGFQCILEKFHWNERIAYSCILFPMLAVNLTVLIDIGKFLHTL